MKESITAQQQLLKDAASAPTANNTPSEAKAALATLPSNTTATKLPANQPPSLPPPYRQDLGAKV